MTLMKVRKTTTTENRIQTTTSWGGKKKTIVFTQSNQKNSFKKKMPRRCVQSVAPKVGTRRGKSKPQETKDALMEYFVLKYATEPNDGVDTRILKRMEAISGEFTSKVLRNAKNRIANKDAQAQQKFIKAQEIQFANDEMFIELQALGEDVIEFTGKKPEESDVDEMDYFLLANMVNLENVVVLPKNEEEWWDELRKYVFALPFKEFEKFLNERVKALNDERKRSGRSDEDIAD
jgi:hypothetical protein